MAEGVRPGRADLHLHSTASDGTHSPEQLLRGAAQCGLEWIAICDHDTAPDPGAWATRAREYGLRTLPGIELGVYLSGESASLAAPGAADKLDAGEVHLLAYGADPLTGPLADLLASARRDRHLRMLAMIDRLEETGVHVTWEQVSAGMAPDASPGRPHLAEALVHSGYASTIPAAFAQFIAPGRPGYVPRRRVDVEEALVAIRASGGVPVLAHPGLYADPRPLIEYLVTLGLKGLEVIHPEHSFAQIRGLMECARRLDLLPSGGSDFHGRTGEPPLGSIYVPAGWARDLRDASMEAPSIHDNPGGEW